MNMILKGQVRWVGGTNLRRQIQFIQKLFELPAYERDMGVVIGPIFGHAIKVATPSLHPAPHGRTVGLQRARLAALRRLAAIASRILRTRAVGMIPRIRFSTVLVRFARSGK